MTPQHGAVQGAVDEEGDPVIALELLRGDGHSFERVHAFRIPHDFLGVALDQKFQFVMSQIGCLCAALERLQQQQMRSFYAIPSPMAIPMADDGNALSWEEEAV